MARLIIFDDKVRGIDLPGEPVIIGRSKKNDIPINDPLLSRKHCAIIPGEGHYRLVDLKSSYGTFLNGARVDRVELSYDDVVEIGNTVMVLMDPGVWNRGEGLARLRNPLKAQELIQRIQLQHAKKDRIPIGRVSSKKLRADRTRQLLDVLPILQVSEAAGAEGDAEVDEQFLDLLSSYATSKAITFWIRQRHDLKRLIAEAVERALLSSLHGDWEAFRGQLREEIRRGLLESVAAGSHEARVEMAPAPPEELAEAEEKTPGEEDPPSPVAGGDVRGDPGREPEGHERAS